METEDDGRQTEVCQEQLLTFLQSMLFQYQYPERWTLARGQWRRREALQQRQAAEARVPLSRGRRVQREFPRNRRPPDDGRQQETAGTTLGRQVLRRRGCLWQKPQMP